MENILKFTIAAGGSLAAYLWGEWSVLLGILVAFVIADYVSGVMAAGVEGKVSSSIGFKAIPKKVMIFVMVAVGHLIDQALGNGHFFRDAVVFFYLANELISIIENAGRVGLPVPDVLKKAIVILKGKSEGN